MSIGRPDLLHMGNTSESCRTTRRLWESRLPVGQINLHNRNAALKRAAPGPRNPRLRTLNGPCEMLLLALRHLRYIVSSPRHTSGNSILVVARLPLLC